MYILVYLRSTLFMFCYVLATMLYGLLALPLSFLLPLNWRHRILISWCTLVIFLLRLICGARYRITGLENLYKTPGPKVILCKHQSTWETLKLQSLFWPTSTILKRELLAIPIFGWGLRALRPIAINRSNPREALRAVKTQGLKRLESGLNLVLFPEGTRMRPGQRGKYARSGPDIAIAAGADILPVAVNAGHCWPASSWLKYPGEIEVVIGQPIPVAGQTSRALITQVEEWIENELERIEGYPAVPIATQSDTEASVAVSD